MNKGLYLYIYIPCWNTVDNVVCIFSERELMFTFAICRRPSVCLSSVTFVHPTQPIEIFGNVSAPCNTLVTWQHPGKIIRRSSQGNPSIRGLNQRVVKNLAILDLCEAISRKRCKIGGKLLLITNRKSHMGFRLAPKSVTLNDLERRNSPNLCVISPNSVALRMYYVKLVIDTSILSAA